MKNKEIEKILKYLKNNTYIPDETKRKYKILHRDEVNLLSSYIEQLKNNYIEANENITWWTNRFNAVERDNRNLKNNRDKAIEYLEEKADYPISYYHCIREAIDILKGGSDEQR